jgi:hypothetical protein
MQRSRTKSATIYRTQPHRVLPAARVPRTNAIDGDIIPPNDRSITVVAKSTLFKSGADITETIQAGSTIAEIVERFVPRPVMRQYAVVSIDDWKLQRKDWHRIRPKPGHRVSIGMCPGGGGGKNILRIVLQIAVLAVGFILPVIPALATPALWGLTTLGTVLGAGVARCGHLHFGLCHPPRRA